MNELTIREQLCKFLAYELTLDELWHWFFSETWDIELDIVYDIKLLFAEYSHSDWTQEELRNQFKDLLAHGTIGDKPDIQIETSTSSVTMEIAI